MPHHWHSKTWSAKTEADVPTYQYACTACGHQLDAVQSFADDPLTECPACEGRLRKLYSSVGIVFKGSGFYRTDSRSANGSGDSNPSGDSKPESTTAPKVETKSETKTESKPESKPAKKAEPVTA
jgi:putative FmdB family regulatory protein